LRSSVGRGSELAHDVPDLAIAADRLRQHFALPLAEDEVDADIGDNLRAGAGVGLRVDRHDRNSGCRRPTMTGTMPFGSLGLMRIMSTP
jgi:hypothetical protein